MVIAKGDSDNATLVLAYGASALVCAVCIDVVLSALSCWCIHIDTYLIKPYTKFPNYKISPAQCGTKLCSRTEYQ